MFEVMVKLIPRSSGTVTEPGGTRLGATRLTIPGKSCRIGRKGTDICLSDARCSRSHALLYLAPGNRLMVRDLRSRNGTFVGGRRISELEIAPGAEIRIGNTLLRVIAFRESPGELTATTEAPVSLPGLVTGRLQIMSMKVTKERNVGEVNRCGFLALGS